ncbi:MAG: hypothetical protein ACK5IC_09265 [Moheibacter sp.]
MKKLFLAITVIGLVSLTSCKKEETKVEESTEQTAGTEETSTPEEAPVTKSSNSDVPEFSNADIQKFANEYNTFYQEMIEAANSGDATKMQDLQAKAMDWSTKVAELTQTMTPEDQQKFSEWAQKLAAQAVGQ